MAAFPELPVDASTAVDFRKQLNGPQYEAVMHEDGPLLVIAGAGSGKTRTLTYRVARLVAGGVPAPAILLLTFTRKAAQEMLRRASLLLDERCAAVAGGTFHAFANGVLRRNASRIGFDRPFTIIDRADSENLVGLIRKESGAAGRAFPTKRTLMNIFSRTVNKNLSIEDVVYDDYPHFAPFLDAILGIERQYQERKRLHRFLDYDDLLVQLKTLLTTDADLCRRIAGAYRYIMVDEYQDTNQIQADILCRLAAGNRNLMVVGDDSQSIYAFRGANFRNIMAFPDLFAGTRVIRLEENYRSVQPILSLTNAVIEQADEKYTKRLFTRIEGGRRPRLVRTANENAQSRLVVEEIQRLRDEGVDLDDVAVLFRAGFHSFDLEIELVRAGVPFVKVGGFKFMEAAHIKDLLAHLRVIVNPGDRLSWHRVLMLVEKIGPKTAQKIFEAIVDARAGTAGLLTLELQGQTARNIEPLRDLYRRLETDSTPAAMGEAVLAYYMPLLQANYEDHPKRTKDLEQLLTIMGRYERLEAFLADMALEPPADLVDNGLRTVAGEDKRLVLSTVHSAKGLEWHTVIVIWTLDGRFPSLHALNTPEDLDEELRLLYVAATRARRDLMFTCPLYAYDRGADTVLSQPSRFLDVLPDTVLERVEPSHEAWSVYS